MPRIGGKELAYRLTALRPQIKVLYSSGYTDQSVFLSGMLEGGAAFLQKPFTPGQLLMKVAELLAVKK
jgi:two-component system cell cycle sensor histidine kinase/response regulator CckA